jgi:hypothetical protein
MTKTAYGIACFGGPKHRTLSVGRTKYPQELCGAAYWSVDKKTFLLAPLYPFSRRKDAENEIKEARKMRCKLFLPYDGYGKCEIVKEHV